MKSFSIIRAEAEDLESILQLQYLAYRSEALLLGDEDIPPLRQTLAEVQQEFALGVILKLVDQTGRIIGSIRAQKQEDSVYIGKLMVHPAYQRQGLGSRLLQEIERTVVGRRYELFTSSRSMRNLLLYEKAGYKNFKEQQAGESLTLVFLQKYVTDSAR